MIPTARSLTAAAAVALLLAGAGCAAIEANRRIPGAIAGGAFAPARPAAARLGANPELACPVGGAYTQTYDKVEKAVKERGATPAVADGRLCAVAEAFLGWSPEAPPREAVRTFVARHFGVASQTPQVILNTLESEDSRLIGDSLSATVLQYANQVSAPRFGIATERLGKSKTRVVIVLANDRVELDPPLPRRLEVGEKAVVAGRLVGELENASVLVSDTKGVVTESPKQPGKAFRAEVTCGAPGRTIVEIRGEDMGNEQALSTLEISCGGPPLPTAVPVVAAPWPDAVPEQEARLVAALDAARAEAGVPALTWAEPVMKLARAVAEGLRDNAQKPGSAAPVNVAQGLVAADIQAIAIQQNPAAGPTAELANERLLASPSHRATILRADFSLGGVGVATGTDQAGRPIAYLVQLFVQVKPPPDVPAMRRTILDLVGKKRAEEKLPALENDPAIEQLAAAYAVEVAAAGGPPPKAKTEEFEKALKKGYRDIVILRDARFDLADFAEDPNILGKGRLYGLGTALGRHPRLGKNTLFVVLVIANKAGGKK